LERANARDQDVQDEGRRSDEGRRETAQGHHGDVTGSASMADRRVKERNDRYPDEEQNQMRTIQAHRSVLEKRRAIDKERQSPDRRLERTAWNRPALALASKKIR
jgi:hypothetical protein